MLNEYLQYIPDLKAEMSASLVEDHKFPILDTLTDSDLISIYAEWIFKNRPKDSSTQNGFIFEILARRILQLNDKTPKPLQSLKETISFLMEDSNQRHIWNEVRSTPDDLSLEPTNHALVIDKLIECKISALAVKNSTHQKSSTKNTVRAVVQLLKGDYHEIKNEEGKKIISTARERLQRLCPLPITLAEDYKYIYVLPSDQHYFSNDPRDTNLEVINLPISTEEINNFRKSFFTSLAKVNL